MAVLSPMVYRFFVGDTSRLLHISHLRQQKTRQTKPASQALAKEVHHEMDAILWFLFLD